jgi:hypothetical protein
MKTCSSCKTEKTEDKFNKGSVCKSCRMADYRKNKIDHPTDHPTTKADHPTKPVVTPAPTTATLPKATGPTGSNATMHTPMVVMPRMQQLLDINNPALQILKRMTR